MNNGGWLQRPGASRPCPPSRRKGQPGMAKEIDRLNNAIQSMAGKVEQTAVTVATLAEAMRSHDERLQRIEGGSGRLVPWLALGVSAMSVLLTGATLLGGLILFVITHTGG